MNDAQIERVMLAHYQVWLAFTTTRVMEQNRWKFKQRACMALAIARRKAAKACPTAR